MSLFSKLERKSLPVRIVFHGLLVAIFSLSLQFELDREIIVPKANHSSIAKVNKDFRYNHGGQREVALTTALVRWTPTFHSYFLRVVDKQNFPALYLLKSTIIRAPPSAFSI